MHRLIYTSQSQVGDDPTVLSGLVKQARRRNEAVGITGMLWADAARFIQVLEGEQEAVADTMLRIRADPRHSGIEVVCDRAILSRMFGGWAMVRPDNGTEGTAGTAFLLGLMARDNSKPARAILNLLLRYDG